MNPKWRACERSCEAESEGIHADRHDNRHFQLRFRETHPVESPETVAFQGTGVITPDGLASLICVDLTRGLGDGDRMAILCRFGFDFAAQRCI